MSNAAEIIDLGAIVVARLKTMRDSISDEEWESKFEGNEAIEQLIDSLCDLESSCDNADWLRKHVRVGVTPTSVIGALMCHQSRAGDIKDAIHYYYSQYD